METKYMSTAGTPIPVTGAVGLVIEGAEDALSLLWFTRSGATWLLDLSAGEAPRSLSQIVEGKIGRPLRLRSHEGTILDFGTLNAFVVLSADVGTDSWPINDRNDERVFEGVDPVLATAHGGDDEIAAPVAQAADIPRRVSGQPSGTLVEITVEYHDVPDHRRCVAPWCGRKRDHAETMLCDLHEQARRAGKGITRIKNARVGQTERVPIESLREGDLVVTYDNSHVYKRGRPVWSLTSRSYSGPVVRVTSENGATSVFTPEHPCIFRLNDKMIDQHVVYLMRRGRQFRIGRVPLLYASQNKQFGPAARTRAEKADALWILSFHDSSAAASLGEAIAGTRFGVPGIRFQPSQLDVMDVNAFWEQIGDNWENGKAVLDSHGLLVDHPLYSQENPKAGLRGSLVTVAANLFSGLKVLTLGSEELRKGHADRVAPGRVWTPIVITRELFEGTIVSIEVADHENYYADNILTHSSRRGGALLASPTNGDS